MTKRFALVALIVTISFSVFGQSTTPQATPLDPVIAKFNEGAAKVNSGDFKNAIADFEAVLTLAEKVGPTANDLKTKAQTQLPVLYYQVATGLMKQKNYEEAIPNLEKTIELSDLYNTNAENKAKALKYLPQLLTGVGSQQYKDQKFPEAQASFDKAIKYDPDYSKAYLGKGIIFADQLKEKDMLENLNKAIDLAKQANDTKTVDLAQTRLGAFYINLGNMDLADVDSEDPDYSAPIASFNKAVALNPAATDALYMLAVIYNKQNDFDNAVLNAENALKYETVASKIAAINYELGIAYNGAADYTKACAAFNKAITDPAFAEKAEAKKSKVPGCE